jgi:hypothetical protein
VSSLGVEGLWCRRVKESQDLLSLWLRVSVANSRLRMEPNAFLAATTARQEGRAGERFQVAATNPFLWDSSSACWLVYCFPYGPSA